MNEKEAAVIKALAELGLHKEPTLTPDQENMLKRALDPEEEFFHQVKQIFESDDFENKPLVDINMKIKGLFYEIDLYDTEIKKLMRINNLKYDATGMSNYTNIKKMLTSIINPFDTARHYITIRLDPTSKLGKKLLYFDRRRNECLKEVEAIP